MYLTDNQLLHFLGIGGIVVLLVLPGWFIVKYYQYKPFCNISLWVWVLNSFFYGMGLAAWIQVGMTIAHNLGLV